MMMGFTKKNWFWMAMTVLYVGVIFHNSMTPALESSRQSGRVLEIVLEATRRLGIEDGWITEHLIRKTAHYMEYCLLGVLLSITLRGWVFRTDLRRVLQCWLGTIIPFVDETIQLFVEGRSGQISDVWLDMAGVWTGYAIVRMLMGRARTKTGKRKK